MDIRKIVGLMFTVIGFLLLGAWKLFLLFIGLAGNNSKEVRLDQPEDPATSTGTKYALDVRNYQYYDD